MSATVVEAPLTSLSAPSGSRELRATDGRIFREGDRVLYHASVAPDYPLWEARVTDFLGGRGAPSVLVLAFVDRDGTRLPEPSSVHFDATPLPGCGPCEKQRR